MNKGKPREAPPASGSNPSSRHAEPPRYQAHKIVAGLRTRGMPNPLKKVG